MRAFSCLLFGFLALGRDLSATAGISAGSGGGPRPTAAVWGELPLQFEANRGQADSRVKFLSRGRGYGLFLTSTEAILSLSEGDTGTHPAVLRMSLVGANKRPNALALEELPGKANYFVGSDPAKWRSGVPTYARVKYENVYLGIDLVYYGRGGQLEYDFVVAPGADPGKIGLTFSGADRIHLDADGDLVVESAGSHVRLRRPVVYQEVDGARREVAGRFVLGSRGRVGFQVAAYDPAKTLTIDPVLVYSTYLGGSLSEFGYGIAVDSVGNAYVTGNTGSANFPTTAGTFDASLGGDADAFVTKLNASGTALVYSTYIGGSGSDGARGIAIDSSGSAYITGQTTSSDFPTTPGALSTVKGGVTTSFVTKLSPDGSSLAYSTYLGGNYYELPGAIAVDASGSAYVTGKTYSADYPTTPGAFQTVAAGAPDNTDEAYVTKLSPDGSALVYSTYLGGATDAESGVAIAVDSAGNAFVAGGTLSSDFPTTPGAFQTTERSRGDGFLTKLNADGSALVYSTYLGGSDYDFPLGITIDPAGNAYLVGTTLSMDFPTTPGAFRAAFAGASDAFVTKVNPDGTGLIFSTYLGGAATDSGYGIGVDGSGNVVVAGYTGSSNFPTTPGAISAVFKGGPSSGPYDAFLSKLDATGSALLYSTYLGGSGTEYLYALALDAAGSAYLTGFTSSTDFPTTPGAFDRTLDTTSQSYDVFVTKVSLVTPTASVCGSTAICAGSQATIRADLTGNPPWSLTWSDGPTQTGITSSPVTRNVSPAFSTTYSVTSVSDVNEAGTSSGSAVVTVNPRPTAVAIGSGEILFGGPGIKIYGFGGGAGQCSWSPTTELNYGVDPCAPTATPAATTTYTLTVTHPNGCASTNNPTVTVTVLTHVPTRTTLRSSLNPSTLGSSVTFTATVAAGNWTPRGTVTFMDGATPLGTLTLSGPPIAMATFPTSSLSLGDHSITAVYGGQGVVFNGSTSDALTQRVDRPKPSFFITPTSSFYGDPVTLSVHLSVPPPAVIVPTGEVTFRDGVVNLGTATLDSSGGASLTIPAPSTGLHPITVFYSGNADILPGTSTVTTLRVTNSAACGILQGPLTPSLATGTNTDPQGVAVGDFDGDGKADLVSANFKSNSVSVYLSNGDGTFKPKASYPVGTNPISVAVADFNGDGHPDLAVANAGSGNVSVLLNADDGTFLPATAYPSGTAPQSVAVGDFNGDGIWDLVVSNQGSANVSVLLGNTDGTFQAAMNSPAGTKPAGLVVGDFNGDRIADVVVANYDAAKISVLIGNGDGTFRTPVSYPTLTNPVSVAAGDFDGNGFLDLAVANWGNSYVSVLLGKGDGTFKAKVDYGAGSRPASVVVGDFNGDGYADLAAGNANSDNVSVLLGKGDGTFQADVLYPAGNQPHSVAVIDVYGNGKPGLVVANELTNDISILPGACPTTTTVASSDISSDFGQSVTFTAHVTSASSGTETGTVTFKDGTTVLGTATLASGSASFSTSLLCPGSHKITAVYSGDSNFNDGTSSALTQTVAALAITAPMVVCPGTGHPASAPDVPGARYVWTITNGTITSGSGTPAIFWVAGMSGTVTLRVTVTTAPGCTATASKAVTNTAPSAVITAPAAVCAGSTGNSASVPSAGTGATYSWEIENGTITSGTVTNAIKFTAGSPGPAILHVTVTNWNGCTTSESKSVTVKPLPDATMTAPSEVCHNSTGNHASVPSVSGNHYSWTITNGTITAGAGTSQITFSAKASGTVTLEGDGDDLKRVHLDDHADSHDQTELLRATAGEGVSGHSLVIRVSSFVLSCHEHAGRERRRNVFHLRTTVGKRRISAFREGGQHDGLETSEDHPGPAGGGRVPSAVVARRGSHRGHSDLADPETDGCRERRALGRDRHAQRGRSRRAARWWS